MILITGATGQIGSAALAALITAGAQVRALVRRPSEFNGPREVQVVPGSFEDDSALARALEGVDAMLLAGRDNPDFAAQLRRVLAEARRAEVRHIVKLSAIGAGPNSAVALLREHHEIDEAVGKGPASWTLLKPHLFLQNLLRAADTIRREGRLVAPMGQARLPMVDTRDIGAAAAVILSNPAPHAGKAYALTGPAAYNYDEVAAAIATIAGRPVAYASIEPHAYEAQLLAVGIPGWRAFDLAHIASAYGAGDNDVSTDLPRLLGRKATSLADFLEDYRGAFAS